MHTSFSIDRIVKVLAARFGKPQKQGISDFGFGGFDIHIRKNDEFDADRLRMYPDGFLYYEYTAETEIYSGHFSVMDEISKTLWDAGIPTVISCDDEEELNRRICGEGLLERLAEITDGDMAGFCLKAGYDEDTGGYRVLFSKDFDDLAAEGYDEWYPSYDDVKRRLGELDVIWKK